MLGDNAQAAPLLQRALRIMEHRLGSDHLDVAVLLTKLGSVYINLVRAQTSLQAGWCGVGSLTFYACALLCVRAMRGRPCPCSSAHYRFAGRACRRVTRSCWRSTSS